MTPGSVGRWRPAAAGLRSRVFFARNGLVLLDGRIVAKLPELVARPLVWLYWDVWWPSWVNWRLMSNPRTLYLVSLFTTALVVWWRRDS